VRRERQAGGIAPSRAVIPESSAAPACPWAHRLCACRMSVGVAPSALDKQISALGGWRVALQSHASACAPDGVQDPESAMIRGRFMPRCNRPPWSCSVCTELTCNSHKASAHLVSLDSAPVIAALDIQVSACPGPSQTHVKDCALLLSNSWLAPPFRASRTRRRRQHSIAQRVF